MMFINLFQVTTTKKTTKKRQSNDNQTTTNNNNKKKKNLNNDNIVSERDRERAQTVANQYNVICKNLPKVKSIDNRLEAILIFLGEIEEQKKKDEDLAASSIFMLVAESGFLNGNNENLWMANFDWIIKNWVRIYEGQYNAF